MGCSSGTYQGVIFLNYPLLACVCSLRSGSWCWSDHVNLFIVRKENNNFQLACMVINTSSTFPIMITKCSTYSLQFLLSEINNRLMEQGFFHYLYSCENWVFFFRYVVTSTTYQIKNKKYCFGKVAGSALFSDCLRTLWRDQAKRSSPNWFGKSFFF